MKPALRLAVATALSVGLLAVASPLGVSEPPASPEEMAAAVRALVSSGAGALMPDLDRAYIADGGLVPLGEGDFPAMFLHGLVAEWRDGAAVFPVEVRLDDDTGDTYFLDALGEPFWYVPSNVPEHYRPWLVANPWFAPSRAGIRWTFVHDADAALLRAASAPAVRRPAPLRSLFPPPVTDLCFTDFSYTGTSVWFSAAWPASALPLPGGVLDVYAKTNLLDAHWFPLAELPVAPAATNAALEIAGTNIPGFFVPPHVHDATCPAVTNVTFDLVSNEPVTGIVYRCYRFQAVSSGFLRLGTRLDTDGDGLSDAYETLVLGTNPSDSDTDSDGLSDDEELDLGTDPLSPDTDGDELYDFEEVRSLGTDPLRPDTDGDGLTDSEEAGYCHRTESFEWFDPLSGTNVLSGRTTCTDEEVWTFPLSFPLVMGGVAHDRLAIDINGLVHLVAPGQTAPGSRRFPEALFSWTTAPAHISVAAAWSDYVADASSMIHVRQLPDEEVVSISFWDLLPYSLYMAGYGDPFRSDGTRGGLRAGGHSTRMCVQLNLRNDPPDTVDMRLAILPDRPQALPFEVGVHDQWRETYLTLASRSCAPRPDEAEPTDDAGPYYRLRLGTGTDPRSADSDGDGLSDATEIRETRTDPLWHDTEGDGIPDSAEVWLGTDPCSFDAWDQDADEDDLTVLEEAVAGTDPGRSDTDGDGVSDATELSQGSDPLDATDGGAAPEPAATMAFPFRLHGDYAAWAMTVEGVRGDGRTLRLATLAPGQAEERTLLLRRGATYRIRLHWLGSPGHGDDLWYCWEARLGNPLLPSGRTFVDYDPTRLSGNEVLTGPGWYCENEDGLLTTHVHTRETSGGNIAAGKTALLHILPAKPEFERDAVGVQCRTDRRVRVALTPESFSPDVQWTLSPVVTNGPRLFAASNSVSGGTSMSGVSNLWVSAGTVPGVYRVEASYPGCTNATATVYSVEVTLNHLWETSNPANRIFNPTYKDDKSDAGYQEHDPCTETTYGIHREKLYLARDPTDRFVFSLSLSVVPAEALLYASAVAYESATESHRRFSIGETGFSTLSVVADSSLESPEVIPIKVHFDFDGDNDIGPGDVESAIPVYDHPTTGETKNATVFGLGPTLIQLHEDAVRDMIGLYGIDPPVPSMISTCPRSFLLLFVDGVTNRMNSAFVPDEVEDVPFSSFSDEFSEWLTHNAGASFSDSGVATLKRYCWSTNSYLSHFLAERTPFVLKRRVANSIGYVEFPTETGTNLHQFVETTVLPQARLLLEDAPDGTVITLPSINTSYFFPTDGCLAFQSESPEWVPGSTIIVGQGAPGRGKWGAFINEYIGGGDQFQEFNANGTIGRGRVANLGYSFTIRKEINEGWLFADSTNYVVVSARVKCRIDDLYDFNYEDGEIAAHAAAMQIRYGNGSMVSSFNNNRQTPILEGHIFLDRIEIDHEYPYPFLYTSVLRNGSNDEHKSETKPTKPVGIIDK